MENLQEKRIKIGDYVQIYLHDKNADLKTQYIFRIVGEKEYNPLNTNQVTTTSPLGKELISKQIGDCGEYNVLGHQYEYEILEIGKNNQNISSQEKKNNILSRKCHK